MLLDPRTMAQQRPRAGKGMGLLQAPCAGRCVQGFMWIPPAFAQVVVVLRELHGDRASPTAQLAAALFTPHALIPLASRRWWWC